MFRLRDPSRGYTRMDFTSDQGADGVRALLPRIVPLASWHGAIEVERARIADPLQQLAWDLRRNGSADPRWTREHTAPEAWRACGSALVMLETLERLGRPDLIRVAREAIDRDAAPAPSFTNATTPEDLDAVLRAAARRHADLVRAAIPEPPELQASTRPTDRSPSSSCAGSRGASAALRPQIAPNSSARCSRASTTHERSASRCCAPSDCLRSHLGP